MTTTGGSVRWNRARVSRVLRLFAAVVLVGALLQVIVLLRADLQHPIEIGNDESNYLAAGERIAAGHDLYGLAPGDRPAAIDNAPHWTVSLLSPPPIAVLWRLLIAAPIPIVATIWWLGGLASATAVATFVLVRAGPVGLVATVLLAHGLAVTAWSGNVNAFLIGAFALVWIASRIGGRGLISPVMAGGLAAVAAVLKLTPVLLVWWLVCTRQWKAVGAAVVVGLVAVGVSVAVAGLDAHLRYLDIGRTTADVGASSDSLTGLLLAVGVPPSLATAAPYLAAVIALALIFASRERPDVSYAISILGLVLASPLTRYESLSMCLPAFLPWLISRPSGNRTAQVEDAAVPAPRRLRSRPVGRDLAVLVVPIAACVIAVALNGPPRSSSLVVNNQSNLDLVVRVYPYYGTASFGYDVPGGSVGSGWVDQSGGINGRLVVFDQACAVLLDGPIPEAGAHLEISVDQQAGIVPLAASMTALGDLRYSSRCAPG